MPRRIDHLIICVRDLAQAALSWRTLGFALTPVGVHPFGTSNRLAMFANNFLELLAVTDAAAIPAAAPGRFSFAAHNQDFLAAAEGMSMLAWHSTDAYADAARFNANDIGAYAPFDFGRDAVLPGGATARIEFSLAIDVLAAAGLGVEHLVKINTFLTDRNQVVANRAIRLKMLGGHEPASTVMIAVTVDGKWLLEIEAIAAE